MALKIVIPGADFSAIGNPKVVDLIGGLPADNLEALYLFEPAGSVGDTVSAPLTDSAGSNSAPLITSSTCIKTAGGVSNVAGSEAAANRGFAINTGIAIGDRFTVFGVSRNIFAAASGVSMFLVHWLASGNTATPSSPSINSASFGSADKANGGALHINQNNNSTTLNNALIGLYNSRTNSTAWDGAGDIRPTSQDVGGTKDAWIAWALSFDRDAGVLFRSMGNTINKTGAEGSAAQVAAELWVSRQKALGGKHLFGCAVFENDADGVKGEMAMAGVYDDLAMSVAEMDALIVRMKAVLADRIEHIL